MGCEGFYENHSNNCVSDVVRKIFDAQKKAAEDLARGCTTSCEESIEELLNPSRERRRSNFTTIPFMLYCKSTCKPFVGSGFVRRRGRSRFIESPIFKVRGFERGSDSCVKLELLLPEDDRRDDSRDGDKDRRDVRGDRDDRCYDRNSSRSFDDLRETGLCITVDLKCFCGITCLDPITPRPR